MNFYRNTTERILSRFSAQEHMLPILEVDDNMYDVAQSISRVNPGILPDSIAKIRHAEHLFSQYIESNTIVKQLSMPKAAKLTPKSFVHRIYDICQAELQHIVLPEATDRRILAAAAEATRRGLATITLLGDPQEVLAQAKKFNVDITGCNILDFLNAPQRQAYAAAYAEARKSKGVTIEQALDQLTDLNVFGTMMVKQGDADGMVSGSCCTTANTIRPGLQLLRTPSTMFGGKTLVSSVFFMCLPDKVLGYGDCAVNVEPTAEELAMIAIASAGTLFFFIYIALGMFFLANKKFTKYKS